MLPSEVPEALRVWRHHSTPSMPDRLSTMTTSTEIPLARAARAAVSIRVRSESESQPPGSVTIPLVVTGAVANAGAPRVSSSVASTATRLKRRIRDTGPSCVVANRQTYTTPRRCVHHVTQYATRDCCREVSLRERRLWVGRAVLFATGGGTPRTRGAGAPYDRGSLPGLQTIDRRRGPCPPVK